MHFVFIGGGNGLSTILKGFQDYNGKISAIVTVFDSGGSSGLLKKTYRFFPPGDIRRCLASLARNTELAKIFNYRFDKYILEHSLGNLILLALTDLKGDFVNAIKTAEKLLDTNGEVLPVSLDRAELIAEFEDGASILGEDEITKVGEEAKKRIKKVWLVPRARLYDGAREAILSADVIVMGPGSLYTSIVPNLLVEGINEAIRESRALKVYAANITTQKGETDNYTLYDHYRILRTYLGFDVDVVIANNYFPENERVREMIRKGWSFVDIDQDKFRGVKLILGDLIDNKTPWRHDPIKFRNVLFNVINMKAEKVKN
ncbi:MAG: gluconeogenesis factor YvcK family protein [Candidatus Njordarchaeia archaeon]